MNDKSLWISVDDRLPEHGRSIVCGKGYVGNQWIGEAFFDTELKAWFHHNKPVLDPTHWMPLPDPPKDD